MPSNNLIPAASQPSSGNAVMEERQIGDGTIEASLVKRSGGKRLEEARVFVGSQKMSTLQGGTVWHEVWAVGSPSTFKPGEYLRFLADNNLNLVLFRPSEPDGGSAETRVRKRIVDEALSLEQFVLFDSSNALSSLGQTTADLRPDALGATSAELIIASAKTGAAVEKRRVFFSNYTAYDPASGVWKMSELWAIEKGSSFSYGVTAQSLKGNGWHLVMADASHDPDLSWVTAVTKRIANAGLADATFEYLRIETVTKKLAV